MPGRMNEPPRLTLPVQVGYATADLGVNTVETMLRLYLLAYYTGVVGLDPELAGLAAALALVWDAVTDPLMGMISDRTRHRLGGRRGYLPIGGVLFALGTLSVFWPPELATQAGRFAWLLGSFCFLNTGMTVLSVPYMAMAGEMTEDPHLRTVLFGWRFAFTNFGAVAAAALPLLFLGGDTDNVATLPAVSAVAAALIVVTALTSWFATRRVRFLDLTVQRESLLRAFTLPLRSPSFRPLLAAYVVATTGIGINAASFLYFYRYRLRLPDAATQDVLLVFLLVFTASILVWVALARRYGKRRPLIVGALVLAVGNTVLYLLVPPGGFWWVMVFGAVVLAAFVGSIVLIDAMLTDVLDHDQLRTGEQRAGSFFGVWRFASKLARAAAVAAVGFALGLAGLDEQRRDGQPASVENALLWLFGPGVGAFFLGAGLVLWRYRFVDAKQAQVRRLLERRARRKATASDR